MKSINHCQLHEMLLVRQVHCILNCLVYYLPDWSPVIVFFWSVFVTSLCDVGQNDDSICEIASPVFCCLVDSPASGILN